MPELMKRREKIEKQERMRAAMETAIRKRAEFVDKMVADYKVITCYFVVSLIRMKSNRLSR